MPLLTCLEARNDDDNHDNDDESDDCDDNHHEDDKDDDSPDNYHRSIRCMTKAAGDFHDNYHCSIVYIANAAESEIMKIKRTMMIRLTTVMISIITASSALPKLPMTVMTTIIVASSALPTLQNQRS